MNLVGFLIAYQAAEGLPSDARALYGFMGAQVPSADIGRLFALAALAGVDARSHQQGEQITKLEEKGTKETILEQQAIQTLTDQISVSGKATLGYAVAKLNTEISEVASRIPSLVENVARLNQVSPSIDPNLITKLGGAAGKMNSQFVTGGDDTVKSAEGILSPQAAWGTFKEAVGRLAQGQNDAISVLWQQIVGGGEGTVSQAVGLLHSQTLDGNGNVKTAGTTLAMYVGEIPETAQFPSPDVRKVRATLLENLASLQPYLASIEQVAETLKEQVFGGSVEQAVRCLCLLHPPPAAAQAASDQQEPQLAILPASQQPEGEVPLHAVTSPVT